MKKKQIICLVSAIVLVCVLATAVYCIVRANNQKTQGGLAAELANRKYEYVYDRPFYSTTDDFMTIDGLFDEPEWEDCVWMETTQYDVTYKITTLFTQKGIYVAAYAEDPNIIFKGRNNFINNSSFEIQIVKEDEQIHDPNHRYNTHAMNEYTFHADARTCRSYRERNFNGAVKCVGEPNSGQTTSLSFEMFMGWDQMHFDESELNPETGIPDSVRIFCQYIMIDPNNSGDTKYISPFLMDYGKFHSYYEYGPNGIVNRPDNGVVGSAIGGTTSTDRWIMDNNEVGGPLSVDRYQTQHIWFTHDDKGNEISRLTSFIVDAQVTADTDKFTNSQSTFGIMTIHDMWNMVTYGVNMKDMTESDKLRLQSIEGIDSTAWVGQIAMSATPETDYGSNTVCLRLIKSGGYYYYFYKHPDATTWNYVGYEYWFKNSEEVDVGLFTNCPSTITNYSVTDYTGRETELNEKLGESVYFVDASDVSGGEITASDVIIRRGESITLTAQPDNGYVLNNLEVNGVDMFDAFVAGNGSLTITPTEDVVVSAKFVRIPTEYLKTVTFTVNDQQGKFVSNVDYVMQCSNPLFVRTGFTDGRGSISVKIPVAGTFEIEGRTYVSDGSYTLKLSKKSYIDREVSFTVDQGDVTQTVIMQDTLWGKKPSVNGKTPVNTRGELVYDPETDSYYALVTTREYYTNTKVTDGQYIYTAVINTKPLTGGVTINPVPGIAITSDGSFETTINLKSAWWENNKLCIEINGKEISISNFRHSLTNGTSDSTMTIVVARRNDVLYIYDVTGELVVTLDENGVHPQGGRTIVNKSGLSYVETQLKAFFASGRENVCGPLVYDPGQGRVDFHISATTQGVEEMVTGGTISVDTGVNYVSQKPLGDYLKGENVHLTVSLKESNKAATKLLLTHKNGTEVITGTYDVVTGTTSFSFMHSYGDVRVSIQESRDLTVIYGQVSGVTNFADVDICFGGTVNGTFGGLVKADGSFAVSVPAGQLALAFICDDKLAIVDTRQTGTMINMAVALSHNDLLVGNATVNGKEITSKATLDFETYKSFASGDAACVKSDYASAKWGNAARKEYGLLLTNSVTAENFTFSSTVSTTSGYGHFGLAITDGENMVAVQIGTGDNTGTGDNDGRWWANYGQWREGQTFDLERDRLKGTASTGITGASFTDVTLKLVKTADGLKAYAGDTLLIELNNTNLQADFFQEGKEYCAVIMSSMISGDIYHDVTFTVNS